MRFSRQWPVLIPLGTWLLIYLPLGLARYYTLQANAYDLSVFDYALWNAIGGEPGVVPFFGHSLGSHHFMPTLYALLPAYAVFQSPVFLILVQVAAVATAAVLLHALARRQLSPWLACGVTTAFLFSQRSHGAMMSPFYVESLEPALVFGLVLSAMLTRWRTFWILVVLALGCKEDVALYLLPFAVFLFVRERRRGAGLALGLVAAIWLAAAVLVAIPWARSADGLPADNPFLQARYVSTPDADTPVKGIVERVASRRSVATIATITSQVGFLCWAAPPWLAILVPGALVNLAARADTLQAGLHGHYIWPLLPWLFVGAIAGAAALLYRLPRVEPYLVAGLFAITVVNSPLPRTVAVMQIRTDWQSAAVIRGALKTIPSRASVAAMPNLIPHIDHRRVVRAIGREIPGLDADYVTLSLVGDLWPLDQSGVVARVDTYLRRADYEMVQEGPLYLFRRRPNATTNSGALPDMTSRGR